MSFWADHLLAWAMERPAFRSALFRLVDVFPATGDDADVLRHVAEELDTAASPWPLRAGLSAAEHVPALGPRLTASLTRSNIERMARHFIVGTSAVDAAPRLRALWEEGIGFVIDLLGEKTVTDDEADRYAARVSALVDGLAEAAAGWPALPVLEADDIGPRPRVSVSIKPTALSPSYAPLTREAGLAGAAARLLPILKGAAESHVQVWFDAEHLDAADITIELARELLAYPGLRDLDAGVVIQAYLRSARRDLQEVIEWSTERVRDGLPPLSVRLVKGAYWDAETIRARAAGWEPAVFARKEETDASYEACTRALHHHHGNVRAAFASHNLRSLAHAVAYARRLGIPDTAYEIQMLYGMAEPVQRAVRDEGLRLRVYAPVGELVPGMGYLIRRLLENTSNDSFLRQRYADRRDLRRLIAAPRVHVLPEPAGPTRRAATDPDQPMPYAPEPHAEWHRADVRAAFARAAAALLENKDVVELPALVGGTRRSTAGTIDSVDPAEPSRLLARSADCGAGEADLGVQTARSAQHEWAAASARERAAVLFGTAARLRGRRFELAATEVFEAGKPWAEADADVCEAIDFCEYYGRQALRLAAGGEVQSPPGEANRLGYAPRGVFVVISPWNFPLAIATGMVTAALVAGNAVCFKPAEQTPLTAWALVEALLGAGLPEGVLCFLPGRGETVGAALVEHPDIAGIAFTGSRDVGLGIVSAAAVQRAGQRHVKRIITEMGGKNPAIVDRDADLDAAVPALVASAFGFSGQKCSALSRLVVHSALYDATVERLAGATDALHIGHPREMGTEIGPLIDAEARAKVRGYVDIGRAEGRVVLDRSSAIPARLGDGYFVGPVIIDSLGASSRLATDEVFGPVLAVFRAGDLHEALRIANDTPYALTAGVFSRSPSVIERCGRELRAGNVYVNRSLTGAVVGRQPFGGYGLSGTGSKAGGPDYLLQFCEPRAVAENTVRQGFSPDL